MKLSKLIPVLGLLSLIVTPVAADERQEAEERCKIFAQEDGVSAEEMQAYMEQCVAELTAPLEEDPAPAEKK